MIVERGGTRIASLRCEGGRASGVLGPGWFERSDVVANGEDFELPD